MTDKAGASYPLADGTVYSKRKEFQPFSAPPVESYTPIVGEEKVERLRQVADGLKGLKLLELNSSAQGGGVAEMLFSSIPFLNSLGIDAEWKVITGTREYFQATKHLHNLLQGQRGWFTPEMQRIYSCSLEECGCNGLIDYDPEVVLVHDPQPLGLVRYLRKGKEPWLWRCHIDVGEEELKTNPGLWDFVTEWARHYDAAIFSAAHYVVSRWPLPKFIIPPFIDPLSEKNRELCEKEIDEVLTRYSIDRRIPIIAQIGRFDPWKGIDRTIATYRRVRQESKCQLVLAGGLAADDPEGEGIMNRVLQDTDKEDDIHVLNLSLDDRLQNWREVNALQRAASVIMQPSTREGFGLVITEALWKGKPVIAADVGAISLQLRENDTGYFYRGPATAARRVIQLLDNPRAAQRIGRRGRLYVKEHFLLPDRIADYLMALDMARKGVLGESPCGQCIISFHPWAKLSKRRAA